jgi:hypothetical protein
MTEIITAPAEDRPHAEHSPSSLALKEVCPGYRSDSTPSVASEEGTRCHLALETGNDDGLDDEQLQVVGMCREYTGQLEAEVCGEGERSLVIHREERVEICGGLTFGTLDYLLINPRLCRADLVDFKFGRNPVSDAEDNPQIQAYVLGVFENLPGLESIKAHILLPRRDEVSTASYTRADMPRLRLRIETIIARASLPEPELRPTDGCLYCRKKATCAALHNHALKLASGYSDELVLPEEVRPSHITDPSVMARALQVARVMEKWCESVRHHALKMRLSGVEIPRHELRTRSGNRKINDALAAWGVVRDRVEPDRFIACCDVSLTKLEDAVAANAPRGGTAKAKHELCESLAAVGAYEAGGESTFLTRTRK